MCSKLWASDFLSTNKQQQQKKKHKRKKVVTANTGPTLCCKTQHMQHQANLKVPQKKKEKTKKKTLKLTHFVESKAERA